MKNHTFSLWKARLKEPPDYARSQRTLPWQARHRSEVPLAMFRAKNRPPASLERTSRIAKNRDVSKEPQCFRQRTSSTEGNRTKNVPHINRAGDQVTAGLVQLAALPWLAITILVILLVSCSPAPASDTATILYHTSERDQSAIWRMRSDGEEATRLVDSGWFAQYAPDNSKIAYSKFYDGGIWLVNADGSNPVQLTDFGSAPDWSPDGKRLVFHVGGTKGSEHRLWIVNADGTDAHRLSSVAGSFPAWSPDGKHIVFHAEVNKGIWSIAPDGSGERLVYLFGGYPAWSPDGTKIAYVDLHEWNIWVMNADGSGRSKLTDRAGLQPAWSPDGLQIVFQSGHRNTLTNKVVEEIWVINADGTNEHKVSEGGDHPDWSN